jgi:hypothetical protein
MENLHIPWEFNSWEWDKSGLGNGGRGKPCLNQAACLEGNKHCPLPSWSNYLWIQYAKAYLAIFFPTFLKSSNNYLSPLYSLLIPMLGIRDVYLGCWIRIFSISDPGSASKILTQQIVCKPSEISGSGSWIFTHPGSRIQGSKRHRIRVRYTGWSLNHLSLGMVKQKEF